MTLSKIPRSPLFLYGYDIGCNRISTEISKSLAYPEDVLSLGPNISVAAARSIRDFVQRSPINKQSSSRVVILEMMQESRQTQAALLSLLEDFAENSYYILKSTLPQSVLPTIRSRCFQQRVDLERYGDLIKGLTNSGIGFGQAASSTQYLEMGIALEDVPLDSDISQVSTLQESYERRDLEMGLEVVNMPQSTGFQTYFRASLVEEWDDLSILYFQPNTASLELLCKKILS